MAAHSFISNSNISPINYIGFGDCLFYRTNHGGILLTTLSLSRHETFYYQYAYSSGWSLPC